MNLGNLKLVVLSIAIASLTACGGGGGSSSTGSSSSNPTSSSSPSINNGGSSNSDSGDNVADVEEPVVEEPIVEEPVIEEPVVDPEPVQSVEITSQPSGQTLASDESINLSLQVSSTDSFSVAWYKNGALISNSATYQDNSLTASDSGTYSCVVTMGQLSDQCSNFTITVVELPGITQSPSNQMVTEGDSFTLSVAAEGSDLSYQWYLDGVVLQGENSSSLSFNQVELAQAGEYVCIVSNSMGSDTSATASVSVVAAIQYGDAEISWSRPTTRSDGSDLAEGDIDTYKVYYGPADENGFADNVEVSGADLSVVIQDLEYGDYKVAVSTVDTDGLESDLSSEFLLAIQ